ncbi:alpha/beta hydrolase [Streptomyces turgidiscabies]|uniref:alpha/beta hydrolase n=1 Tax=Streptomyces turgidiscabies TaxID=85558 RepID=UPI0038F71728
MFFYDPYQAARNVVSLRKARATRPDPQPSDEPADPFDANFQALHWAVVCADNSASWPRDPARYRHDAIRDGARLPLYGDFTSNITPCAFWPRGAEPATRVSNTVGALILQNQWDSQTPAASGRAMHRALRGSCLFQVRGGRDHGVYGIPSTPVCATITVNTYLVTGRLPSGDITCRTSREEHAPRPAPFRSRWESPGTFLGLPAPPSGTSVKQLKGHSHRSATIGRSSWQVTAFAGLFRDM